MDQYHNIEFAQIDFEPQTQRGGQSHSSEEIELERVSNTDNRTLKRLVRASKLISESALEKLQGEGKRNKGAETLGRSNLETIEEVDESADLEAQLSTRRVVEKEIV
jgi:hypothetical protein